MRTPKLDDGRLQSALASLPGWTLHEGELRREFRFSDFRQAMSFVEQVADLAEAADHHPDIDIRYNRVQLALVTHDSGGITQKDVDAAEKISRLTMAS